MNSSYLNNEVSTRTSLFYDVRMARRKAVDMSREVSRRRMRAVTSCKATSGNFATVHSGSPEARGVGFTFLSSNCLASIPWKVAYLNVNDTQGAFKGFVRSVVHLEVNIDRPSENYLVLYWITDSQQ